MIRIPAQVLRLDDPHGLLPFGLGRRRNERHQDDAESEAEEDGEQASIHGVLPLSGGRRTPLRSSAEGNLTAIVTFFRRQLTQAG
jgi:hypothetical protein